MKETEQPPAQPLTNEQIEAIGKALLDHGFHPWEGLQPWVYTFARRIEQAHGIEGARNG